MKYVIFQAEDGGLSLETITTSPSDYLSGVEPIDVIDGQVLLYDESGDVYQVEGGGDVSRPTQRGSMRIVNVGEWDFANGEPKLRKVASGQSARLKELLINILTQEKVIRKGFFKRSKAMSATLSEKEYSNLTLHELIHAAETKLTF